MRYPLHDPLPSPRRCPLAGGLAVSLAFVDIGQTSMGLQSKSGQPVPLLAIPDVSRRERDRQISYIAGSTIDAWLDRLD